MASRPNTTGGRRDGGRDDEDPARSDDDRDAPRTRPADDHPTQAEIDADPDAQAGPETS